MLKNGPKFGKDYFDELLVKIKEIAYKLALEEQKKYRVIQDKNYISDFDELVIETKNLNKT